MPKTAADILGDAVIPELLTLIHPIRPERVLVRPAPATMRRVWNRNTGAMTIRGQIFVRPDLLAKNGPALRDLVVHELVHARQWHSGSIRFLGRYLRQYVMARFFGARHHLAYLSIDAEVEARQVAREIRGLLDDHIV